MTRAASQWFASMLLVSLSVVSIACDQKYEPIFHNQLGRPVVLVIDWSPERRTEDRISAGKLVHVGTSGGLPLGIVVREINGAIIVRIDRREMERLTFSADEELMGFALTPNGLLPIARSEIR